MVMLSSNSLKSVKWQHKFILNPSHHKGVKPSPVPDSPIFFAFASIVISIIQWSAPHWPRAIWGQLPSRSCISWRAFRRFVPTPGNFDSLFTFTPAEVPPLTLAPADYFIIIYYFYFIIILLLFIIFILSSLFYYFIFISPPSPLHLSLVRRLAPPLNNNLLLFNKSKEQVKW